MLLHGTARFGTINTSQTWGNAISTLKQRISSTAVLLVFIATIGQLPLVAGNADFGREQCAANVTAEYQDANGMRWDSSILISITNILNPILSLKGCEKLCGAGTGWYPDIGPRLIEWFLPIFLLVSNMQFPLIGMERFFLVLHLLGDPIDSTWSLMDKVDSWSRCYALARERLSDEADVRSLAIIYAAWKEVEDHVSDHELKQMNIQSMPLLRATATMLMRQRSNEILRTIFAVAMYVFQVVSDFVPSVGASSSPSGGKIGPAMLLSWLVSVVLLSNAIGDMGPPATTEEIVLNFMKRIEKPMEIPEKENSMLQLRLFGMQWGLPESSTTREESLVWSGAVYSYRPNKGLSRSGWKLALVSILPVMIAFGTAFGVLQAGPTFFSCRSIFVIVACGFWVLSAILTYVLSRQCVRSRLATGKYLWNVILIKDILVAAPLLSLIVATSCGYWNTCYCWGGGPIYGDKTQVPLNPTNIFNFNDDTFYPAVVGVGLGLQVVVFMLMLSIGWDGLRFLGLQIPCPKWLTWLWKRIAGFDRSPLVVEIEPERELRELSRMEMRSENKGAIDIIYLQV